MKTSQYITLAVLALGFAGCSQDDDFAPQDSDIVKIASANIATEIQSRVNTLDDGTTFEKTDRILLVNGSRDNKNSGIYTYNGTTWSLADGMVLYASSGTNDFTAYYPASVDFTLPTDQSTEANIKGADRMVATATGVGKGETVALSFERQNAKITITPTVATEFTGKSISSMTIAGVTPYQADGATDYTAIITPSETGFTVSVTVDNQPLTAQSSTKIEAGKHYAFSLTVGKVGMTISNVSVQDWTSGTIEGGEAELVCFHEEMTIEYVWSEDHSSCTATATCNTCNKEVYSEKTTDVVLDESPDADGNCYWRATFANTVFEEKSQLSYSVTDNTYKVYDANGLLAWKAAQKDGSIDLALMKDIDMSDAGEWTPVGDNNNSYVGTINGNGYAIRNIMLSNWASNDIPSNEFVGFVGDMLDGEMKNITFDSPRISMPQSYPQYTGAIYVGIVANMFNSTMTNVSVTGEATWEVDKTPERVPIYAGVLAGLLGGNNLGYSTVENCHVENGIKLSVTADDADPYVGGIAGYSVYSYLLGCTSAATISVTGSVSYEGFVGGIMGYGEDESNTNGCVYCGNLTATLTDGTNLGIGGIAGGVYLYGSNFNIVGCYVTGEVTGDTDNDAPVGAIAGNTNKNKENQVNNVKSCYWSGNDGLNAFGDNTDESTCYKVGAKVEDEEEVTWDTAKEAMNAALTNAGAGVKYTTDGATTELPLVPKI